MKRRTAVPAIILVLAMTFTACSGGASQTPGNETSAASAEEAAEAASTEVSAGSEADPADETAAQESSANETAPEETAAAPRAEVYIEPTGATASSRLADDGSLTYGAENVLDDNRKTAWNEGAAGEGIGEYLEFTVPAGCEITGGTIETGYCKSKNTFDWNGAVSVMTLSSGENTATVDLTAAAQDYDTAAAGYDFRLEEPLTVSDGKLRLTVTAVRSGSRYEDTCISDIRFTGYAAEGETGSRGSGSTGSQTVSSGSGSAGNSTVSSGSGSTGSQTVSSASGSAGNSTVSSTAGEESQEIGTILSMAYNLTRHCLGEDYNFAGKSLTMDDLTDSEKAFLLYWYQYNVSDSRITYDNGDYEYHVAAISDMSIICEELTGDDDALDAFLKNYVEKREGGKCYMCATGDFGDAGEYVFMNGHEDSKSKKKWTVTADVEEYDGSNYRLAGEVTVTLVSAKNGFLGGWRLERVEFAEN